MLKALSTLSLCLLFVFTANAQLPPEHFPVDDYMRPRVNFWKMIFSEIHSYEGLIHDDEDLSIVYEKVSFKGKSRRSKTRYVRKIKKDLRRLLRKIIKKRKKNLNEEEEELLSKLDDPPLEVLRRMPKRVRFQQGMRDPYLKGLKRSYLYLDKIRSVFDDMGLPIELGFLPHVESSFNYLAYSKVGAAGIWQFMRSTGRIYKLKLNYVVDERRDPVKATYAAARLLRDNYKRLKSWPLALTAYNHGARSLVRAVKKIGNNNISDIVRLYKGRRFGFASRNFYASFVAAAELAQNPEPFFGEIEKEAFPAYSEIKMKKALTVNQIRKAIGIDLKTFKKFNLAIRPVAYRNSLYLPKGFTLKVPQTDDEKISSYKTALNKVKVKTRTLKSGGDHIVSRGESLFMISKVYKTSVADLIALNRISNPSRVYPGMRIKIPGDGFKASKRNVTPLVGSIKSDKKEKINAKILAKQTEQQIEKEDINENVKPIGIFAHEEEPKIPSWKKMLAYVKEKVGASKKEANKNHPYEEPEDAEPIMLSSFESSVINSQDLFKDYDFDVTKVSEKVHFIIVEAEETLGHYCDWLIVPSRKIRKLNGKRRNSIRLGQKLKLPMNEQQVVEFNIKRVEHHMLIQQDFYENFDVEGIKEYKVRRGDTLSGISSKFEIPLWLLKKTWKSKGLVLTKLRVGQKIIIPEISSKTES